jgi:DNA-directed RNA polymerase specialized sigma24 family protein
MAETKVVAGRLPWWQDGLMAFAKRARPYLRHKYPALAHLHDDLIAETVLSVTAHLSDPQPSSAPLAWYLPRPPTKEEQGRFNALCHVVLSRRINDQFRERVRSWSHAIEVAGQEVGSTTTVQQPDDGLEVRRLTARLLTGIAELPKNEQLLLERVALGDTLGPMTSADRQRLHRVRSKLVAHLTAKLGADPLEIIRRT